MVIENTSKPVMTRPPFKPGRRVGITVKKSNLFLNKF